MARLAIKKEVLRDLAIRSKNKCAFPGCDHAILNPAGDYIAELCHIEGAEPGSPRFNPAQSDEERSSYENLLFFCHEHHKETDDEQEFPTSRLKEIKASHEALPAVVFNSELLLDQITQVLAKQDEISALIQKKNGNFTNYAIRGPVINDAWTPEQGRFYTSRGPDGSGFKFMMKDGWLHVEQTQADGKVGYYEINEEGNVRDSMLPYPINEYTVEIPEELILRKEPEPPTVGDSAIRTILKWSRGSVVEHFLGGALVQVDCHARSRIEHATRRFIILGSAGEGDRK